MGKYLTEMLFGGKNKVNVSPNPHLEEIDRQVLEMEQRLISQLAQQEGVTEQLKAENQMGTWASTGSRSGWRSLSPGSG